MSTYLNPTTRFRRRTVEFAIAIAMIWSIPGLNRTVAEPMSFTMIGNFPGGAFTNPTALSADGSVVVGYGVGSLGQFGFRWTRQGGLERLESYLGDPGSRAYGISADGTVIVGITRLSIANERAVRWTTPENPQLITNGEGIPLDEARDVSGDGSAIIGHTNYAGYLINQFGVFALPELVVGHDTWPWGISNDGSVIAGYTYDASNHGRAVRWTAAGGLQNLGVLPGFATSLAFDVSADGSTVVGRLEPGGGDYSFRAFRWTAATGMQNLGKLPAYNHTQATSASADGSIVVGNADDGFGNRTWIWTAQDGMRDLLDVLSPVLPANCDCTLAGVSISDDGRVLTGQSSINGQGGAWVAVLPEPSTSSLYLLMLAFSIILRRRNEAQTS